MPGAAFPTATDSPRQRTCVIAGLTGGLLAGVLALLLPVYFPTEDVAGAAEMHRLLPWLPGAGLVLGALVALVTAPLGALVMFAATLTIPWVLGTGLYPSILFFLALVFFGLAFSGHYLALSRIIDQVNSFIGRWLSWLVVAAVLVSATNAVVRKIFDTSSNSFLELQWVMFSIVFLLCSPWTLLSNEHIRIDIINQMLPGLARRTIDLVGHVLFLMPFALLMILYGAPFFWESFKLNEQSFSAGGLPQWPAKSLILIGFVMLAIQGVSEIIKRIASMRGLIPEPYPDAGHHHPAESEARVVIESLQGTGGRS